MRSDLQPMLASLADAPLDDPQLVYEPKYDGIRAIAEIRGREPVPLAGSRPRVHLWSRLGNEKTRQFPEIAAALEKWAGPSTSARSRADGKGSSPSTSTRATSRASARPIGAS